MLAQFIGNVNQWHALIVVAACFAAGGVGTAWLFRDPNWLKKQRLETNAELDKLKTERDAVHHLKRLEEDYRLQHAKLEQGLITSHRAE